MKTDLQVTNIFYIYKITNLINKKLYIGKTSGDDPNIRFYNHGKRAFYESTKNECPKLYNSIRKYGIENFSFEVVQTFDDENSAYDTEEKLIANYNCIKNGMNTSIGGNRSMSGELNPMYGKGHLISGEKNGMYGRSGSLNPFYGKKHSPETIEKIKKQKRVLSDEDVIKIKQMIYEKVNYNIITAQFDISMVTICRIKFGQRYVGIGPEYNFSKYNRSLSDNDLIMIRQMISEKISYKKIALQFKTSVATINRIKSGAIYGDGGKL